MADMEIVIRLVLALFGVMMTGLHTSGVALVIFKLAQKLAPIFHCEQPNPRTFKNPIRVAVDVLLNQFAPTVDARTSSQNITATILMSVIGTVVVVSMATIQITSMSAVWGGAVVFYSFTGFAFPLEDLFVMIVILTVLLAGCLMWEANLQIRRGIKYA
ncbi:hypothetical protein [Natronosalvus amylolyticus]|uniref:hypothetical protein n=1 Tax=Natronosalvus amylolyticus TaxID=2961994 RepID=UPI0020C9AC87|nr:hypothetical protein [Natronosalvus amylolyticus]